MTLAELLQEYYEREMNNVFCYSGNYLMNIPKKGYEQEWNAARERADLLRAELTRRGVTV